MAADPAQFLRFAAERTGLLRDLFDRVEGVADSTLRELVECHRGIDDAAASHIESRLREYRMLEQAPGGDAFWELTRPVRALLEFLYREHRRTSSRVIQAFLDDLAAFGTKLDSAAGSGNELRAASAVGQLAGIMDRVREESRQNREAISGSVMRIKAGASRLSLQERFETINSIWHEHIEPLRQMIDVRKTMEAALEGVDVKLISAARAFPLQAALRRDLVRTRYRLTRLRRDAASDFRVAVREVQPLFRELRRDSRLARGAAIALRRIDRDGVSALRLEQRLALPIWRLENAISDSSLEAHWAGLRDYRPAVRPRLDTPVSDEPPLFLDLTEVLSELQAACPMPDALDWLIRRYPSHPLRDLLRVYARLHDGAAGEPAFGAAEQRYRHGHWVLRARPMLLETSA